MLYFLTVVVDHPRRIVDGMSFVIKFWTDRMYGFRDIAIFRFWKFDLKIPFGGVWRQIGPNDVTHRANSQKTVLWLNHVI